MNIFSVRHIVHIVLFPIGSWEIILVWILMRIVLILNFVWNKKKYVHDCHKHFDGDCNEFLGNYSPYKLFYLIYIFTWDSAWNLKCPSFLISWLLLDSTWSWSTLNFIYLTSNQNLCGWLLYVNWLKNQIWNAIWYHLTLYLVPKYVLISSPTISIDISCFNPLVVVLAFIFYIIT